MDSRDNIDRYIYGWNDAKGRWAVCKHSGADSPIEELRLLKEPKIVEHIDKEKFVYAAGCVKGMILKETGAQFEVISTDDGRVLRGSKNEYDWDNKNNMKVDMPVDSDGVPEYTYGSGCGCG